MASSYRRLHPVTFLASLLTTSFYIVGLSTLGPVGASNLIPDGESPRSEPAQGENNTKSNAQKLRAHAGTKRSAPKQKNSKTTATDLTGTWYFEISHNEHRGYIKLKQSGTLITGIWHTTSKQEDDTPIVGQVYGNKVALRRSKVWGSHDQTFDLEILQGGVQLYGYGEGFFLHHSDLNMRRVEETR